MTQNQRSLAERRGLRFPFTAEAQIILANSREGSPARVTELSLQGCLLETSLALQEHQHVQVKIFHSKQFFEASAEVIYVRPNGVGVTFVDLKPHFRGVLQAWILAALDNQAK